VPPSGFFHEGDVEENSTTERPSWIPLSRGIEPYLGSYTPEAITLYLTLALRADWREGKDYGVVEVSVGACPALAALERQDPIGKAADLSARLGMDRRTVSARLRELALGNPIGILTPNRESSPPFIKILEEKGRTKGKTLRIKILKAKLTAKVFRAHAHAHARQKPDQQPQDLGDPKADGEALLEDLTRKVLSASDKEPGYVSK